MASKEPIIEDIDNVDKTAEFYSALQLFLQVVLHKAMLFVLHTKTRLPKDPEALYQELSNPRNRKIIDWLRKRTIIPVSFYEKLFPPNSNKTDSNTFDFSLIFLLIRSLSGFPVCKTGWERVPNADDLSTVAFVIRARNWRNWITHEPASEVNESVFETKWNEGCYIAHGLGYKSFDQHSLKQKALKKSEVMDPAHFYQMTSDPRGFCIIINNSFLSTVETRDGILLSQRNGTDVDGKAIEKLFGWLQFKVETKENVGRSQMLKILRDYALDDRNVNHDCLVICILSHGYEKGIYCNDGQEMDFAEMREYFNGKNCPNLNGKPKLFYIQACQGSGKAEESHITDGPPSLSLKSDPVSPGLQEGATVSASDKEPSPPPSSLAHYADFSFFVAATPGIFI
ncbi:uncharacterized protein [Clytia hemisphaerica]|uniref:uncharacterized protein n=1 Tax=Clytia hemisphaerica TaxID=252671 RepID=UPI0034D6E6FA